MFMYMLSRLRTVLCLDFTLAGKGVQWRDEVCIICVPCKGFCSKRKRESVQPYPLKLNQHLLNVGNYH